MENKLKTILSGTGFYVALAACVLAAGVGGYFLLFHEDPQPEEDLPALAEDSAFSPYVRETEPVVETTAPAPLEAAPEKTAPEPPPAPMPGAAVRLGLSLLLLYTPVFFLYLPVALLNPQI